MIKFRFEKYEERAVEWDPMQYFYELLNGVLWNDEKFPPFRDKYSAELIRDLNDGRFVEGDWYSLETPWGRTCLSALHPYVRYGLVLIHYSQKRIYTAYQYAGERLWEYLRQMPFDILLALPAEGGFDYVPVPYMQPLVIENYRYQQREVECRIDSSFPEKMELKNGVLYGRDCDLSYQWMNFLKELGDYLKRTGGREEHSQLFPLTFICTWSEFCCLIGENIDLKRDGEERENEWMGELQVVNHLKYMPEPLSHDIPYLIVVKRPDGSYRITENRSEMRPSFADTFLDLVERLGWEEDRVGMALALNVEETMNQLWDIEKVYYGLKSTKKQVELFNAQEALQQFGELLREALDSGNYRVENSFDY